MLLLGYLGLILLAALAVVAPLLLGRWLSNRDRELEEAEVAVLEERALMLLAGRSPETGEA